MPMEAKDYLQLLVSALAPAITLGVAALGRRERIALVLSWSANPEYDPYARIGIHNRSEGPIAITRVSYAVGYWLPVRCPGTALSYEDWDDLQFPYVVAPGTVRHLALDERQALELAHRIDKQGTGLGAALKRSRVWVEVATSTNLRRRIGAELVLAWKDRLPWASAL